MSSGHPDRPGRGRPGRRRRVLVWAMLLVGLAIAGASGAGWASYQGAHYGEDREDLATSITASATTAFQRQLDFEAAFAEQVATVPDLTNARLGRWLSGLHLASRFPGTLGFAFVEPVPAARLGDFEASMRRDPLVGSGSGDFTLISSGAPTQYCLGRLGIVLTPSLPSGADFCARELPAFGPSPLPVALADARGSGRAQFADIVTPCAAQNLGKAGVPAASVRAILETFLVVEPVYDEGASSAGAPGSGAFMGWMVGTFSSSGLAGVAARSDPDARVTIGREESGRFVPLGSAGRSFTGGRALTTLLTDTSPRLAVRTAVPVRDDAAVQGLTVGLFGALLAWLLFAFLYRLAWSRDRARDEAEQAGRSLDVSEHRFEALASAAPIGILETTPSGEVTYANPKAAEITGRSVEALLGSGWLEAFDETDARGVRTLLSGSPAGGGWVTTRCRVPREDDGPRWVRMLLAAKRQDPGAGLVVTLEDITDETRAHQELRHQAFHDGLTGLPNRARFLEVLEHKLGRLREDRTDVAVFFMDLDDFKRVNDSLGHDAGDAVLKVMARRLARAVRADETVARLGGDEFLFVIGGLREPDDAATAATRLLEVVRQPVTIGDRELTLTGSMGIVLVRPGTDALGVLRDADTAMYEAKQAGRNRFATFDDGLHQRSMMRLETETALRRGIEGHEFVLYFQPSVQSATGRPVSAEALVRWMDPENGLVTPDHFIPVAEESGLIIPLGRWVLEQAVAQLAAWDRRPDAPHLETLAVNVSARQLDDPGLTEALEGVLARHTVAPGRLALEVTESVLMADSPAARRSLEVIRKLGVRVAIDDFGTGYSSMAYLHSLPVTTVKIDRSFVERLGGPDDSTAVVRAVVDMSRALGLRVVAEGVSDGHLARAVASLGCDLSQGFWYAPPLECRAFEAWWRDALRRAGTSETARAG